MKQARIVIGAGYGDEGKGISTDYLSQGWADLVVRFNGGAQAAHTVCRTDPNTGTVKRHVFGHFGSATLQGVPTYLGPKFVVNPWFFEKELAQLHKMLILPDIYIDPECYVTTIFDMLVNRIITKITNHGTCGAGFNETITRCYDNKILLQMKDLYLQYEHKIEEIQKYYLPARLRILGLSHEEVKNELNKHDLDSMAEVTIASIEKLKSFSICIGDKVVSNSNNVVFEGAQGLMLDEKYGSFPYVTRSRTGLKNAMELIRREVLKEWKCDKKSIEVYYITRAYTTRHGNGPLDFEEKRPPFVIDKTNIKNEFQGELRYAPLNVNVLQSAIDNDTKPFSKWELSKNLIVTCTDQIPAIVEYYNKGKCRRSTNYRFFTDIFNCTKFQKMLLNNSPMTPAQMESFN